MNNQALEIALNWLRTSEMNKPRVHPVGLSMLADDILRSNGNLGSRENKSAVEKGGRARLAQEEAAIEAKIVDNILNGRWQLLQPNSGISVEIKGSHVCVDYHDDSGYRVWEWHGHCMMYEEGEGYCPEYIYGNYFEPLIDEDELEDFGSLALNTTAFNRITPVGLGFGGLMSGLDRRAPLRSQFTGSIRRGK